MPAVSTDAYGSGRFSGSGWAGLGSVLRRLRGLIRATRASGPEEGRSHPRSDRERTSAFPAPEDEPEAAADQAKARFLGAISHEFRTPLNAVIGFADLLVLNPDQGPLTHRQRQSIDQIRQAGRQLLALVDDVLDLARVEAGGVAVRSERLDPQLIVRGLCHELAGRARLAGVTLHLPPPTAGLALRADPAHLKHILTALLTNAIQYNRPGGSVLIEMRHDGGRVALSVRDTGPGLPPDRMTELFQPFSRLGRECGSQAGTGVGLAMAHRLALAMGGDLQAESQPGQGSCFTLRLPAADAAPMPRDLSPVPDLGLRAATVLYVEDHPANVVLMRHVMAALGDIHLHVATTAHQGLTLARDLRPDVIILDIHLPDMDGIALKGLLDDDPLTRGIPVLALSAAVAEADRQRGYRAGFRAYLTKPLHIPDLARALDEALSAGMPTLADAPGV